MEKRSEHCSTSQESQDERMDSNYSDNGRLYTIPCYTEAEANALEERLMKEETFKEALQVLINWLEEGQCNMENSKHFYPLIQLCSNHVEKLQVKKKEYSEEAQKAQASLGDKSCCILLKLIEIEGIFKKLQKQDIWGCFTQGQQIKMYEMIRDILDFKQTILTRSLGNVVEEEKSSGNKNMNAEMVESEAGSLSYGLNTVNQTSKDPEIRCDCQKEISKLKLELEKCRKLKGQGNSVAVSQCNQDQVCQIEMLIVSKVSRYLFKYPDGVGINRIYEYVIGSIPTTSNLITASEVQDIMRRYKQIFKDSSPIGAISETTWTLVNLKALKDSLNE